jgi:acyl-CoA thioesterase
MATAELIYRDRFVQHVGIELLDAGEGEARARLKLGPHHLNGLGIVQGGAIFTLADYAFAAASNSRDCLAVALDTHMTFLKASRGGTLTAICREVGLNRRTAFYAVDVTDESGTLIAAFHGTAYLKPIAPTPTIEPTNAPAP